MGDVAPLVRRAVSIDVDAEYPELGIRSFGKGMRVAKACVDTGGRDTAAVYGHIRRLRDPRIAPTKGVDGWNRAQPVQGPTPVDALVDGRKHRRGLKLWTVSVSTWKADLYRRLWLGRGDAEEFPPGWVHLPQGVEAEWVKQLVAEQLCTAKDRRGFRGWIGRRCATGCIATTRRASRGFGTGGRATAPGPG